jgi:phosphatidate phosphatase PAH1
VCFHVWLYGPQDRLVIVDIDGTITKSDVTGYIQTVYFGKYSYIHRGIVEFLTYLVQQQHCHIVYLTARPNAHRKPTTDLLQGVKQKSNNQSSKSHKSLQGVDAVDSLVLDDQQLSTALCQLPEGPLLMNKDRIMTALYREVILKDTMMSKVDILEQINDAFRAAGMTDISPYVWGIGNKEHDAVAYNSCGVSADRILIINPSSELSVWKQAHLKANTKRGSLSGKLTAHHQVTDSLPELTATDDINNSNSNSNCTSLKTASVSNTEVRTTASFSYHGPYVFKTYADPNLYRYVDFLSQLSL